MAITKLEYSKILKGLDEVNIMPLIAVDTYKKKF
jgi:hypothetical protein